MGRTQNLPDLRAGAARRVDIQAIEQELASFWELAGAPEAGHGPVTTARVLNLIAVTARPADAARVQQTLSGLIYRYPCRAILVLAEVGAPEPGLEAWIQAHCQLPDPSGVQVCCEQISLQARGAALRDAGAVVLPLLVPDLPVSLWWLGEPPGSRPRAPAQPTAEPPGERLLAELFGRLLSVSDQLIVDSAAFAGPGQGLRWLAARCDQAAGRYHVADLAWARLAPWRTLLAQCFDPPEARAYLTRIERIELEHAPGPDGQVEAVLLVAWLASRLGWEPGAAPQQGAARLSLRAGPRTVAVELYSRGQAGPTAGAVRRVALYAGGAHFAVRLTEPSCAAVEAVLESRSQPARVLRLPPANEAELLARLLDTLGGDPVYEAALMLAAQLSEAAGI
jgi:glucose-6-phosphate dehydrogenase assembly protein OpcA